MNHVEFFALGYAIACVQIFAAFAIVAMFLIKWKGRAK